MKFKEEIRSDLAHIKAKLEVHSITLNKNTDHLAEHIKRTEILENQVFSWKYRILMYSSVAAAVLGVFKAILALL